MTIAHTPAPAPSTPSSSRSSTPSTHTAEADTAGMAPEAQQAVAAGATALPDLRPELRRALDLATSTAAAVRPEQLGEPTPCSAFDVAELVRHLAGAMDRAVCASRGEVVDGPLGFIGLTHAALVRQLAASATEFTAAWADDATLERVIVLPWATLPGRVVLAAYLAEISTHTWDLAVATGQHPAFEAAAVEIALAMMRIGLPAERDEQVPFGAVQPVADDAPAIERLVAWQGRRPTWPN